MDLERRLIALEARVATLEGGRWPTLAEVHVEVLRRLRIAKEKGDLDACRRLKGMLARLDPSAGPCGGP